MKRISYSDKDHVLVPLYYNNHEDGHIPSTTQSNHLSPIVHTC